MAYIIMSGITTQPNANGVYFPQGSFNNYPYYRHISKNYYIFIDNDDWYLNNKLSVGQEIAYTINGDTNIFGEWEGDSGSDLPIVKAFTGTIEGTIGTSEINKNYIDKAYMGDDGVAVDVS